jgi:hypothetical protein
MRRETRLWKRMAGTSHNSVPAGRNGGIKSLSAPGIETNPRMDGPGDAVAVILPDGGEYITRYQFLLQAKLQGPMEHRKID